MNGPIILLADPRRSRDPTPEGRCRWLCQKGQGAAGKGILGLVTCVMKGTLFCMEGHREVTGVGDLDDVGSDVTKDDVAKVQDILWQLDSETVEKLSSPVTFPKVREREAPFRLLFTILYSRTENN